MSRVAASEGEATPLVPAAKGGFYDAEKNGEASGAGNDRRGLRLWELAMVASLTALSGASANIYVPVLPKVAKDLGTSSAMVNLSLTMNWIVSGVAAFFWGPLSDSVGRMPTVSLGLCIFAAGTVVSMCAHDIWPLIGGRMLQGLGEGMGQTVSLAVLRDCARDDAERRKYVAHNQALLALSVACAPMMGGYLGIYFGWRAIFWFLLLWGVLTLVNFRCCFRETNPVHTSKVFAAFEDAFDRFARRVLRALRSPRTRAAVVTSAALFGGRGCSITILTYTLQNYFNQTVLMTGFWLAVTGIGAFAGGTLQTRLFPTKTVREIEAYADGSTAVLFAVSAGIGVIGALCAAGRNYLCHANIAEPIVLDGVYRMLLTGTVPSLVSLLMGSQPPDIAGALAGFYSGLKMIFFGLGSLVATLCYEWITPNQPAGAPSVLFITVAFWVVPWLLLYWAFARRPCAERDQPLYNPAT